MTLICRDATHQPKITRLEAENADLRTALEGALRQKTEAEERGEQLAVEMGKRERELQGQVEREEERRREVVDRAAQQQRELLSNYEGMATDYNQLRTQLDAVENELSACRNKSEQVAANVTHFQNQWRRAKVDLLALQVEYGRVKDALARAHEWLSTFPPHVTDRVSDYTGGQAGELYHHIGYALSSPSPAAEVGETLRAIAEAIEDEWCYGKPDEKHARGDCTACNLASALRALGLGAKE